MTKSARYPARLAAGPGIDQLSLALQQQLTQAEIQLALAYRAEHPAADDLLVVDGPLRGRSHLDRTVGYIKSHHASYLPAEQAAVVAPLRQGQRTPAFTMGTSWRRVVVPAASGPPGCRGRAWSGSSAGRAAGRSVTALADLTARVLPPLASSPHKDPRAPQNLVPIGGLERELRRRLGDQQLLYRALRSAAMLSGSPR